LIHFPRLAKRRLPPAARQSQKTVSALLRSKNCAASDLAATLPTACLQVSGGMQSASALPAPLLRNRKYLFDEPTTGLDPIMAGVINDLIREIVTEMGRLR
jgi:ABC-type transporter Mla maintaining outer membrane lipid asymmetry ATPase subunit MlaF